MKLLNKTFFAFALFCASTVGFAQSRVPFTTVASGPLTLNLVVRDPMPSVGEGYLEVLMTVLDSKGAPVEGLKQSSLTWTMMETPVNATCMVNISQFTERQPGTYLLVANTIEPRCVWVPDDYLYRLAVKLPNAFGMAPVKFTSY